MDKAIKHQIEMARELADLISEDVDVSITPLDILSCLATAGLSLMPTVVSPVNPEVTLATEAYFAELV
jgi:hypothetical protein